MNASDGPGAGAAAVPEGHGAGHGAGGAAAKLSAKRRRSSGVPLKKHLDALRLTDLRDVFAFWTGAEAPDVTRRELLEQLEGLLSDEGVVYRRVKTLTRKVLDVLLLLLRRDQHASDLPGLFRRLPGEESVKLEYHEAEAGLKALLKRGFLAELAEGGTSAAARVCYAVPLELAELLNALFREETRTVAAVLRLGDHLRSLPAAERARLRLRFPALGAEPDPADASRLLTVGGAPELVSRLGEDLARIVERVVERHGGLVTRAEWSHAAGAAAWARKPWAARLEEAGVGTVARLSLGEHGILCDDEVLTVFREVLEDLLTRRDAAAPAPEAVASSGCDLYSDLCWFLEHVRRVPVKTARDGEIYKAGLKRIQDGFVSRETVVAGPSEVWAEVRSAAEHLALVTTDAEGFLQVRPEAERFVRLPLEKKAQEVYQLSLEQPGPSGRSLHQHELRKLVAELLVQAPERWWRGRSLVDIARHRYLSELEPRGIRERFRDRFFSAWFSGRETLADLARELERHWLPRLYLLGIVEAALDDDQVVGWRLSSLGARVLGATVAATPAGARPLRVNPDFEVVVLPEGDVSEVVHRLDGYAPRTKSGEVMHFRLTREGLETAVMGGRTLDDLLAFLEARSLGGVPQNVGYTLRGWAQGVSFATLERGVVLRANDEQALERILAVPGMAAYVLRRLSPREVFLREEPQDRRLLTELREQGVHLQ